MGDWWNGLTLTLQILYCIAVPASLILVVQAILLMIGMGGSGEGVNPSDTSGLDGSGDTGGDFGGGAGGDMPDAGGTPGGDFGALQIFSLQGIMIFFCVFGWSGIILLGVGAHYLVAIPAGFVLGFLCMYGLARLLHMFSRIAKSGTFETRNLLGVKANVYVPIPPKGQGRGKVMVSLAERYMEFFAESEGNETLPTNTSVRVVDVVGDVLIVTPDD